MTMSVVPKPCSRCGAGIVDEDYNDDDKKVQAALCGEVQMAFGLIAWLCHECRRQWHRSIKEHRLHREYMRASLALDFWKSRIGPGTDNSELDKGLRLLDIVEDLELEINNFANEWLMS